MGRPVPTGRENVRHYGWQTLKRTSKEATRLALSGHAIYVVPSLVGALPNALNLSANRRS